LPADQKIIIFKTGGQNMENMIYRNFMCSSLPMDDGPLLPIPILPKEMVSLDTNIKVHKKGDETGDTEEEGT